jgi:hypothetical protein
MHFAAAGTNLLSKKIHYRKYLSNLIAGIILLFEVTACQSIFSPQYTPTPTPNPPAWFTEWLNNPVCQPPCWEGITPGKTTITDTQKILIQLPWLMIDFGPGKLRPLDSTITITWKGVPPSQVAGYADSDDHTYRINQLGLQGDFPTKIKELIAIYGDPTLVYVPRCDRGACGVSLIFMSDGMMIELYHVRPDWRGYFTVTPDAEITRIWFFPPGEDGFSATFPTEAEIVQMNRMPWVGYSKYKSPQ